MAEAAEGTRQQAKADRPEPPNPLPALDGTAPGGHKCAARLAEIRCRLLEDVGALDSVLASLPGGGSAPSHLVQLERRWPPSPPPSARRRPSPRAARVGAAHAAQGGLSPAAGGAHSCDGGPLATQISTGAECVKPTEQPAQPSDESADLPPQPVVSRTSGSRVSESRSAGSKTVSSRFSEKVFAAAAVERGEKDRSSPGSPVSVKPPGVDARRRSGASEPRGKRAEGVFSDHKESMGSSFELFFGLVIGSNALMSGLEVQYRSVHLGEELPPVFLVVRHLYTVLFLAELVLRVYRIGFPNFFTQGEVFWAWLDSLVVLMGLLEMGVDIIATAGNQEEEMPGAAVLRNVRLARLVRLTRAFRLQRIIRFIAALRMLVYSIMATLKSLMWAMVLLLMIIYVFGLAFTGEALDHVEQDGGLGQDRVDMLLGEWGSLDRSMFTLFQSISGGVSWREPAVALQGISVLPTSLFTVYIAFVYFAVLNVVTGVFCSSAVETTQRNPDLVAKSIIDNRRACTEKLQQLFGAIDDDASGLITIDELELISEDDLMKAYFQALQIDFRDAYTLFKLIDASNDGAIKLDDFLRGCEKLKGNATSMEMAEISYDMRRLATQVSAMLVALDSNGRCRNEMDDMLKPSAEKLLRARLSNTSETLCP